MNYTAITIGPIVKTLSKAKSTKAIWAASYLFSWMMKQLLDNLPQEDMLMPYHGESKRPEKNDDSNVDTEIKKLTKYLQVGLYPDVCILKGHYDTAIPIKKIRKKLRKKIAVDLGSPTKMQQEEYKAEQLDVLKDFIDNYFQIHTIQVELPDEVNPIIEISKLLSSQELAASVVSIEAHNYLTDFLEKVYYNFLIKKEFKNLSGFPSTAEIATREFEHANEDAYIEIIKKTLKPKKEKANQQTESSEVDDATNKDDGLSQQEFYKKIKAEFKEKYRNYHKYIAIVQADGDNMGKLIKALYKEGGEQLFKNFSAQLFEFTKAAVDKIKSENYNGFPIYAGGDDLLFFAPVAKNEIEDGTLKTKATLFNLINEIDALFKKYIIDNEGIKGKDDLTLKQIIAGLDTTPSMSYGISISYYKYPLNEALENARELLFTKAKSGSKNQIAFEVRKHSGQLFGSIFKKENKGAFLAFRELTESTPSRKGMLSSIAHVFGSHEAVFYAMGKANAQSDMFDHFFANNFNESLHLGKGKDDFGRKNLNQFMQAVKKLVKAVYEENPVSLNAKESDQVYATLHDVAVKNLALLEEQKPSEKCEDERYKEMLCEIKPEKLKKAVELLAQKNKDNLQKIYASLRFLDFITNNVERDGEN